MNYTEAREFINKTSARGIEPGLTTIENLLMLLGNPQDELKFIHVAGTNGKGSVLAYLSSVLQESGYTVGQYISPTLFSYRERIQINAEPIDRDSFARIVSRVSGAMEQMEAENMALPTVFEVETAVSFLYFREKQCDLVLLEVGMGGRLDATNVIRTPVLTVLAPIGMDHMSFLGDSLAQIAWNKAGIFKRGAIAVSAQQKQEAREVILQEAQKTGCACTFVDPEKITGVQYGLREQSFHYGEFGSIVISLAGKHQISNAALALECIRALRTLGYEITYDHVLNGMRSAVWRGRFTVIHESPLVIMDGAHNPDAAQALCDTVREYFPDRKKYFILGVFSDKEYDKIIDKTAGLAQHIFTVQTPDNPRALPAEKLAEAVRRVNPSVEAAKSIRDAVDRCIQMAQKDDVILIFGSLSFLGEAQEAVCRTEFV